MLEEWELRYAQLIPHPARALVAGKERSRSGDTHYFDWSVHKGNPNSHKRAWELKLGDMVQDGRVCGVQVQMGPEPQ